MKSPFSFLTHFEDYAVIIIRLAFGAHLIYYTQDNVFSYDRMMEFSAFLEQKKFPFPFLCANLSVYIQFLCGISFITGFGSRVAGIFIMINFLIALTLVHWGQDYQQYFPALHLSLIGFYFIFRGSGPFAIDRLIERRVAKKYYKGTLLYKL